MFSISNHNNYRFLLIALFAVAGTIITLTSLLVGGYFQLDIINKEFEKSAKTTLAYKKQLFDTELHTYDINKIFDELVQSDDFELIITDKTNHIIQSSSKKFQKNAIYTPKIDYDNLFLNLFFKKQHSFIVLSESFEDKKGLKLHLESTLESLTPSTNSIINYIIALYIIIISISFPMIFILSRYPARLHIIISKHSSISSTSMYVCLVLI